MSQSNRPRRQFTTEQKVALLRQHVLAPDEPAVSLPLDREVAQLRRHRQ